MADSQDSHATKPNQLGGDDALGAASHDKKKSGKARNTGSPRSAPFDFVEELFNEGLVLGRMARRGRIVRRRRLCRVLWKHIRPIDTRVNRRGAHQDLNAMPLRGNDHITVRAAIRVRRAGDDRLPRGRIVRVDGCRRTRATRPARRRRAVRARVRARVRVRLRLRV